MEYSWCHFGCDTMDETGSYDNALPPSSPASNHDAQRLTKDTFVEASRKFSESLIETPAAPTRRDREGDGDAGEEEERTEERVAGREVRPETEKKTEALVVEEEESGNDKQGEHGEGDGEGISNDQCEEEDKEEEEEEEEEEGDTWLDEAVHERKRKFWDEINNIICEVIENAEIEFTQSSDTGEEVGESGDVINNTVKEGRSQREETEEEDVHGQKTEVSQERSKEQEERGIIKIKAESEVLAKPLMEGKHGPEMQQDVEKKETTLLKGRESNYRKEPAHLEPQQRCATEEERTTVCQNKRAEALPRKPTGTDDSRCQDDVKSGDKNPREGDSRQVLETRVEGKLVISIQPSSKVHQVKSVPVVPPKPQHCRLTALGLRQQQQQRQRGDVDRERENLMIGAKQGGDQMNNTKESTQEVHVCREEQNAHGGGEEEDGAKKERQTPRRVERERRKEWDECGTREAKHSPISMCFDEAVALATMKRGREKEKEIGERERQRDCGHEGQ